MAIFPSSPPLPEAGTQVAPAASTTAGGLHPERPRPKVFVQLAWGQDARQWRERWEDQSLIGINDPSPYGYERAARMGCEVAFSQRKAEHLPGRLLRLAFRALLGFDYLHARRNAQAILASDVVWTHTESQYLAVAMILAMQPKARGGRQPLLLGQSVWLFDQWPRFSRLRRAFYRRLIREVDVLTVHSPENLALAQRLFPEKWIELVRFGIPSEQSMAPTLRNAHPARIICLGNDRHRDWQTVLKALRNQDGIELTIVSQTAPASLVRGASNCRIVQVRNNEQLLELFSQASFTIVPLKPNLHASGITTMQEAALRGVPIIASDTGGLRAYFDDSAVQYVRPGDAGELRAAVRRWIENPSLALAFAEHARQIMTDGRLGCEAYIARHVSLTRTLMKEDS